MYYPLEEYPEYKEGQQPCDNFIPSEIGRLPSGGMSTHCCPRCLSEYGVRIFCDNCKSDHHKNGWETCR